MINRVVELADKWGVSTLLEILDGNWRPIDPLGCKIQFQPFLRFWLDTAKVVSVAAVPPLSFNPS